MTILNSISGAFHKFYDYRRNAIRVSEQISPLASLGRNDSISARLAKRSVRGISPVVAVVLILALSYGAMASSPPAGQRGAGILDLIRRYQVQTTSAAPQQAERVVHFPPDKDLGLLKTIEASKGHPSIVNTDFDYRVLGAAKGDVIVPAGRRLVLFVGEKTLRNLPSLSSLKPDDLYSVNLNGSYSGGLKLGDNHLAPLAGLTGLKQLAIANADITQGGIQHLLGLKNLNYLEISSMSLDDGALPYIAELSSLETLVLGSPVSDEGLRHLAPLKNLKELFLWVEHIRGPGLKHLGQLPNLRYLQVKDVDEKGRYKFGDSALQYIKDIPSLRELYVWYMLPVTDAGAAYLAECTQLEVLRLGRLPLTDRCLADLKRLPRLKALDVSGGDSKVTDAGTIDISEMKSLESLSLPSVLTDAGTARLAGLTRLKSLQLGGEITDAGTAHLAGLKDLEKLEVWSERITDAGISHIAKLKNLKELHIYNCRMTNNGLAMLAGLKSLEKMTIRNTEITLSGLNQINSLVNLRELLIRAPKPDGTALDIGGLVNLQTLHLGLDRSSEFRDEDFNCLSKLTQLADLQMTPHKGITNSALGNLAGLNEVWRLSVGSDKVTDDGLADIANMKGLTNLSLTGKFTDAGLEHLERLRILSVLDIMKGGNFSTRAVNDFRRKMPHLTLYRNFENPGAAPRTAPAGDRTSPRRSR